MSEDQGPGEEGLETIRAAKKGAKRRPKPDLKVVAGEQSTDSGGAGDDAKPKSAGVLPQGCPVTALGMHKDTYYFIDQRGQLRIVEDKALGRAKIKSMFGSLNYLLAEDGFWPRKKQDKDTGEWITTGWKPEDAESALMKACADNGFWSPVDRVRGRGAWLGENGELIINCGDTVLEIPGGIAGEKVRGQAKPWKEFTPGLHAGMVYERGDRWLRPDPVSPPASNGPADQILTILRTWNWYRKEADPKLMLGWLCAAMLGGALHWRVVGWITGGHGTGKSSLERLLKSLFGGHGMLNTGDATEAGVRQTVGNDSLPVALDEQEPDPEGDNRRLRALIGLAKNAASGTVGTRGSADGKSPSQSIIRSAFMLGSILIPDMTPAERSRLVLFELHPLESKSPPELTPAGARELGNKLMRRLVDNWHCFPATVATFRDALREAGHAARGQDVFGTLLACAHVALSDDPPTDDELQHWQEVLARDVVAELEDEISDEAALLNLLLSITIEQPHDRKRFPIGHWVGRAAGRWDGLKPADINASNAVLIQCGLKVVSMDGEQYLAVANRHHGLAKLLEGSRWRASPGGKGGWVQALRRLPGIRKPKITMYFGSNSKATLLPLDLCLPSRPAAATQNGSAAAGSPGTPIAGSSSSSEASTRSAADTDQNQPPRIDEGSHDLDGVDGDPDLPSSL